MIMQPRHRAKFAPFSFRFHPITRSLDILAVPHRIAGGPPGKDPRGHIEPLLSDRTCTAQRWRHLRAAC